MARQARPWQYAGRSPAGVLRAPAGPAALLLALLLGACVPVAAPAALPGATASLPGMNVTALPAAPSPAAPPAMATPAAPPPATPGAGNCLAGYVLGGGDTTPKDLLDAPRRFAYRVKTDGGALVTVTYTAYPPSPAGQRKIRLAFHAGSVQTGDYLKACGRFDPATQTLTVTNQGDYIETYATRP